MLVDIDPGALLLDLQSGQLFRLNQSAALVWRRHLLGESAAETAHALSERYEIAEARARRDVDNALQISRVAVSPAVAATPTEFHYERRPDGYMFSRRGQPLFLIDSEGRHLSRAPSADLDRDETRCLLSSVAPKLLSLRGETVLHASAVSVADRVMVFSGASGAGKTTTARAMVKAGAGPIAEDKLVVRVGAAGVDVAVDTESVVAAWVDDAAAALFAGQPALCDRLAAVARCPTLPLAEVGFLSADRRAADSFAATVLEPAAAASAIFSNSFYGSDEPADWRRQLTISAAVGRMVRVFELTAPAGVPGLVAAAEQTTRAGTLKPGG
ncbi:MAG TPA: PqqD family peptide modification chaperone [Polyangia bacterium]